MLFTFISRLTFLHLEYNCIFECLPLFFVLPSLHLSIKCSGRVIHHWAIANLKNEKIICRWSWASLHVKTSNYREEPIIRPESHCNYAGFPIKEIRIADRKLCFLMIYHCDYGFVTIMHICQYAKFRDNSRFSSIFPKNGLFSRLL